MPVSSVEAPLEAIAVRRTRCTIVRWAISAKQRAFSTRRTVSKCTLYEANPMTIARKYSLTIPLSLLQYKIDCRVTIELLDSESEEVEKPAALKAQKFSKYVERLSNPALGAGGTGGGSSNSNSGGGGSAGGNDSLVETGDIKMEEEEENAEVSDSPNFSEKRNTEKEKRN